MGGCAVGRGRPDDVCNLVKFTAINNFNDTVIDQGRRAALLHP